MATGRAAPRGRPARTPLCLHTLQEAKRSRLIAMTGSFALGVTAPLQLLMGPLSDALGWRAVFIAGAITLLLVTAVVGVGFDEPPRRAAGRARCSPSSLAECHRRCVVLACGSRWTDFVAAACGPPTHLGFLGFLCGEFFISTACAASPGRAA